LEDLWLGGAIRTGSYLNSIVANAAPFLRIYSESPGSLRAFLSDILCCTTGSSLVDHRWSQAPYISMRRELRWISGNKFLLTLWWLTWSHQRRTSSALVTTGSVSLAIAIYNLPNGLTLPQLKVLSFLLGCQRLRISGDLIYVQRANLWLFLCFLAVSRLSAQHSGVARL